MHPTPACIALALVFGLSSARAALADPIVFSFSGPVHRAAGTAPQHPGDLLIGSLTLDPDELVTTEQGPSFRRFQGAASLHLRFERSGDPVLEYNLPNQRMNLVVNDNADQPPYDAFRPTIFDPDVTFTFGFFFTDRTGAALSSTDFPRNLNLPAFDATRLFFGSYWEGRGEEMRQLGTFSGATTSLNGITAPDQPMPIPVPDPGSLLLVTTGLAGLIMRRRAGRLPVPPVGHGRHMA